MLAVALYFCTAFSFTQVRLWAATRFSFAIALRDRYKDWQEARLRKKMQKELEKRRAAKPAIQAQVAPARTVPSTPAVAAEPRRTGIERFAEEYPVTDTSSSTEAAADTAHQFRLGLPVEDDDYDGFVAEAMAGGVMVVAARTPINEQRCEGGRAGFLVPRNDPNEMTHAILTALFKPEAARARSEASRQTVAKYRSRYRARALALLYEKLSS